MPSRLRPIAAPLFGVIAALLLFACGSTMDLVLDDPAFREDMVIAAIEGQQFSITPEDYASIRELYSSDIPEYRQAAVILAEQADVQSFGPLIVAAALDVNPLVSETALEAISRDPETYRDELMAFLDSEDPMLRSGALRILSESGGEDLIPLLISYFDDPDPRVGNQASLSVCNLTDRNNPFLRDALQSSDTSTAAIAYRTIGRYSNPDDAPLFVEAFISDSSEIRREAQLAILRLGEAGLPFLHIQAGDSLKPYRVRLSSLEVIQGLRSPESLEILLLLLADEDERISRKARSILGTYGSEAIPALRGLYEESGPVNRAHAVRLMGEIGALSALPLLASALEDSSREVREEAYSVLEGFGPDAWPILHQQILEGGTASRLAALNLCRKAADPWLFEAEEGVANVPALLLLIRSHSREEIEVYLQALEARSLSAETVLALKDAWDLADDFAAMDRAVEEGTDPYLGAWRQREIYAVASRETLQKSFSALHQYFETREAEYLSEAQGIRAESRRLEAEANRWRDTALGMEEGNQSAARERLRRYRLLRESLVRTWEYIIPDLRELAEAVYADRGLNPAMLSRESALLD